MFNVLGVSEYPDFINQKLFYTGLLGVLLFNYFYVILLGGFSLLYSIVTNFSVTSLVMGYFLHYIFPFEVNDFSNLVTEFKQRAIKDINGIASNFSFKNPLSLQCSTDTLESDLDENNNSENNEEDSGSDNSNIHQISDNESSDVEETNQESEQKKDEESLTDSETDEVESVTENNTIDQDSNDNEVDNNPLTSSDNEDETKVSEQMPELEESNENN